MQVYIVKKRRLIFHKTVSLLSGFLLVLQSIVPTALFLTQVHAQETIASETAIIVTPTEEITPTQEPTPTIIPTITETPTPTEEITPTPEPTGIAPTPTEVPQPTETGPPPTPTQEQGQILDGLSTVAPTQPPSTPAPTITPVQPETGDIQATIIKNVAAPTLDLDGVNPDGSAQLSTDKADYAPTDTAIITGSDLTPGKTYSLTISSTDDPATSKTVSVTADDKGTFIYAYQLDGIYRPNYTVVLTNNDNQIVATVTFTDTRTTDSATLNGGSTVTVNPGNSVTAKVTATLSGGDNWHSTSYQITTSTVPTNWTCVDTNDKNNNGTYTSEDIALTAPVILGTYNVFFRISGNNCSNSGSATTSPIELTGGIVVEADITPPDCPMPTFSNFDRTHYVDGNTIYYSPITGSGAGGFRVNIAPTDTGSGIQKVNFPATTSSGADDSTSTYKLDYDWWDSSTFSGSANITCYDNAGNTSTSIFNVIKDNTYPTLTSVILDDYTVKNGATINVTSDGADLGSGVDSCHAFWSTNNTYGGDNDRGDLGTDCDGPITFPNGTGTRYIIVRVGDNVGYYPNPIASAAIIVDNSAPNTDDDTGFGGQTFFETKTVTLTATDTGGSGVADTKYCVADSPAVCTPDVTYTAPIVVTCPGVTSCIKWVFYQSTDNAGNVEASGMHSYNFNITNDLIAPTTTDSGIDGNWHSSDVTVTLACNDTGGSTCANTYYTTDGTDPDTNSTMGNSFTLSADGEYIIKYFSKDNSGNTEIVKTATYQVKIDKTNPTDPGTPTANVSSPTNQTLITWSWSIATDTLSGINYYIWNLWKGLIKNDTGTTTDTSKTIDVSPYGDGDFSFDVQTEDNAGNKSGVVASVSTTVDTMPPVITIDPYDTSWTNNDITISASTNEGTLNTTSHIFSANGSFDFVATDDAGNITTETVIISNIDKENPSAPSVTTPVNNGYITSPTTQKFVWTASTDPSPGSGLATTSTYQYQIDNNSDFSSPARNVSQTATTKTLATPLSDGVYYIQVRAKDAVGNYSSWSVPVTFTVDSTVPSTPSVTTPIANGYINSPTTQTFVWTSSTDSGSGLATTNTYQYNIDNNSDFSSIERNTSVITTTKTLTNPLLDDNYYIKVRAKDAAGNYSSWSVPVAFTVDTTSPTGTITTPSSDATIKGTVNIEATADDGTGSGVSKVEFYHNPIPPTYIGEATAAPYSITWDTTSVSDGSHNIYIKVFDTAGNNSEFISIPVTVDNTPPQLTSAETQDTNGDGNIDAIKLTFNENINDTQLTIGSADGWDVADPAGNESTGTGDTANDNVLLLSFGQGPTPDSGNTPTVTYTATGGTGSTHDTAGNELASLSTTTTDGALPVILSAETQDINGNGKIDGIKLTFSEDIKDSSLSKGNSDGWDVVGYGGEAIDTGSIDNDNILLLTITEGPSYDVDTTPTIKYTNSNDLASTHDMANNELATHVGTTTDKAAPTKPVANPVGGDYLADQSVTLTAESNSEIRYTTDEATPSAIVGEIYSAPILIGTETTLKAIVIDTSENISDVMTETYGIAPKISAETTSSTTTDSVTVTWTTDDPATSRVVYDTISHPELGAAPNYGYPNSTVEADNDPKVTSHSVTLTGLTAGTTYYYRVISHGSPESVSEEKTLITISSSSSSGGGGGPGDGLSDGRSDGRSDGMSSAPLANVLRTYSFVYPQPAKNILGVQTQVDITASPSATPTPGVVLTTQKSTNFLWFFFEKVLQLLRSIFKF